MWLRWPYCALLFMTLATLSLPARPGLGLQQAVSLALIDDPVIVAAQARAEALVDDAVADGELPDPKLKTGVYNLPVDDFDHEEHPTTQWRFGVVQAFPRGDTLRYKRRQTEWLSEAEKASADRQRRELVRDVRSSFLELYYQLRAKELIGETRRLFAQLVDITRDHYSTGRVSQQDVLLASLELSRLDDRGTRILHEEDKARAMLVKWIDDAALGPVEAGFPRLATPPSREEILTRLPEHPVIRAGTARVEAGNQSVSMAREQYKPGWSAGLEYRKRFGDDPDGDSREDMMAAMVTVDIPLFTADRQDKRLSASMHNLQAAQMNRDALLRELRHQLDINQSNWERLNGRADLYESQLLNDSAANAEASFSAYQSGVTEFNTLMRARITDLDVRLNHLRILVDRAKAQANLLYLAGDE